MNLTKTQSTILKIVIGAVKLPIILLIIGYSLSGLVFIQPLYQQDRWHTLFDILRQAGFIISALGYVLFFYIAVISLCETIERFLYEKNNRIIARIISVIRKGLKVIFAFIAIYTVIVTLELKDHQQVGIAHKIIVVFMICVVAWLALQVISTIEAIFYDKYAAHKTDLNARRIGLVYSKIHQIKNVVAFIIMVITVAAILMVFESVRNVGVSILASAGFLTAILGLAAQKSLSSLFVGMQLALSQPFGIGDTVVVEKEFGTIEEITLSYVIVRIWDSRRLLLPVNYFIEKPFANWSHSEEGLLGTIKLNVDYSLPIEPVRVELNRILNQSLYWNKKEGKLIVSDFKDHAVELSIIISADYPAALGNLLPEVREKILIFINQTYPDGFPKLRALPRLEI